MAGEQTNATDIEATPQPIRPFVVTAGVPLPPQPRRKGPAIKRPSKRTLEAMQTLRLSGEHFERSKLIDAQRVAQYLGEDVLKAVLLSRNLFSMQLAEETVYALVNMAKDASVPRQDRIMLGQVIPKMLSEIRHFSAQIIDIADTGEPPTGRKNYVPPRNLPPMSPAQVNVQINNTPPATSGNEHEPPLPPE